MVSSISIARRASASLAEVVSRNHCLNRRLAMHSEAPKTQIMTPETMCSRLPWMRKFVASGATAGRMKASTDGKWAACTVAAPAHMPPITRAKMI